MAETNKAMAELLSQVKLPTDASRVIAAGQGIPTSTPPTQPLPERTPEARTVEQRRRRRPVAEPHVEITTREEALRQVVGKLRAKGKPQLGAKYDPAVAARLTNFCHKNKVYGLDFQTKEEVLNHVLRRFLEELDTAERFAALEAVALEMQEDAA